MNRPFADKRPFGPISDFSQLGGRNLVGERKKGENIEDSLVGRMRVRIVSSRDALNNLDKWGRDNKAEILSKANKVAVDALNDHLGLYAPAQRYRESNVSVIAPDKKVNGNPVVDTLKLYFWLYEGVTLNNTNQAGTRLDSESWLYIQDKGESIHDKIAEAFEGDKFGGLNVEDRDTVITVISPGYLPSEVAI